MSREIDLTQPLSADDAQFVLDRPWILVDAALNGVEVTFEEDDFDSEDASESEGGDVDPGESDEEDESEDEEDDEDEDEEEEDDSEEDDSESEDVYDTLDVAELRTLAEQRELPKGGNKTALLKRLREDDASK